LQVGNENERDGADPLYVEARRVLLDALTALTAQRAAVIVAGAQAVYLRTGDADIAVAPYTTDGDLALDPSQLSDDPTLESAMRAAGFDLGVEPGIWLASASVNGEQFVIPVDLIVPEGAATGGGRRGARLGPHGNRAARRARGLEAALIDHDTMTVSALDPADTRSVEIEVAGPAALFVAKAHKLHDRVASNRVDRLDDKDASDVVRLMQTASVVEVGATFVRLCVDPIAGTPSTEALTYIEELFGRRGRPGIDMASRALRADMPEERIEAICTAYTARLLEEARRRYSPNGAVG
jgi:ribosomal protein L11